MGYVSIKKFHQKINDGRNNKIKDQNRLKEGYETWGLWRVQGNMTKGRRGTDNSIGDHNMIK